MKDYFPDQAAAGGSWWQDTLVNGIFTLAALVFHILYWLTNVAIRLLDGTSHIDTSITSFQTGWQYSIYFVNIFFVLFLIAIAFANATRLEINTYEIKKTLPSLIAGFVLANLSFLIISVLLDFSDLLVNELLHNISDPSCSLACRLIRLSTGMDFAIDPVTGNAIKTGDALANWFGFFWPIGAIAGLGIAGAANPWGGIIILAVVTGALILYLLPTILLFILSLVFLARYMVIFILITIAPIAIIFYSFPPTRSFGETYVKQLFTWIFLAPAVFFLLYLATLFGDQTYTYPTTSSLLHHINIFDIAHAAPVSGYQETSWIYGAIRYVAGVAVMIAAIMLPFQLGGIGQQLITGITNLGKKAGGYGWEQMGIKEGAGHLAESGIKFPKKVPILGTPMPESWAGKTLFGGRGIFGGLGKLRAGREAAKLQAEKNLATDTRYNNMTELERLGDMKNVARRRDKSMESVMYNSWDEDQFKRAFDETKKDHSAGFNNLINGKNTEGAVQENLSNMFGALKQMSLNDAKPERKALGEKLLGQLMTANGIEFDEYMNVKGTKRNPENQGTLLDVAKNPKDLNLSDTDIVNIAKTSNANAAAGNFGVTPPPNGDQLVSKAFESYNKSEPNANNHFTTVNKLFNTIKTNAENNIRINSERLGVAHGNLSAAALRAIMDEIRPGGDIKNAQDIARNAGAEKLNELLKDISTDKNGAISSPDNNIVNYQIKEAIKRTGEAKQSVQNTVQNSNYFTTNERNFVPPHGGSANSTEQIIYNGINNIYKDHQGGENFKVVDGNTNFQTDSHEKRVEYFFDNNTKTTKEFKKEFVQNNPVVAKMIDDKRSGIEIRNKLIQQGVLDELKPYLAMFIK